MLLVSCAVVLCTAVPTEAFAWGAAAHRFIMRRAIDLLPAEMKPFFEHYREELVLRVIDPDLWRTAGFDEDANHFLDFGVAEYGAYPFAALPRDYDAAIEKFGLATVKRNGLLPWREADMFGQLRRAFESLGRREGQAPGNVVLFAAAAAHYIQDAHQPLHASNNYDGQLTGQRGLHARFESDLFERFESKLTIEPAAPMPMMHPRDVAFDILLESFRLVPGLLDADKKAIEGKDTYDDQYFEKLLVGVKPMLEQRLRASITQTASLMIGAWTAAGKPMLVTMLPRRVEKVRAQ